MFAPLVACIAFFIPQTVRDSPWDAHYRVLRMAGQTRGQGGGVCVKSYKIEYYYFMGILEGIISLLQFLDQVCW